MAERLWLSEAARCMFMSYFIELPDLGEDRNANSISGDATDRRTVRAKRL